MLYGIVWAAGYGSIRQRCFWFTFSNTDRMCTNRSSLIRDASCQMHVTYVLFQLAPEGRWVSYGFLGGTSLEPKPRPDDDSNDKPAKRQPSLLALLLAKRLTLIGTTLKARSDQYKRDLTRDLAAHAKDRCDSFFSFLFPLSISFHVCLNGENSNMPRLLLLHQFYWILLLTCSFALANL